MNRNHVWKLVLILLVLFWSIVEMYPPKARPLVEFFRTHARVKGEDTTTFKGIMDRVLALEEKQPQQSYANLMEAIGTNDIVRFFPQFAAENEAHPTTYILNRLQREAAGKIKLGIDLAGGTSFLVEMDTNNLHTAQSSSTALSQAIDVFRKRVDALGVAEPVIQPEGENRILIQLPGLSEQATEDARKRIQKVAFLQFRMVHPDNENLIKQGVTSQPGYELLTTSRILQNGQKRIDRYFVKKHAEVTGGIKRAGVTRDQLGRPEINFTFDDENAKKFAAVTTENVGHQLAIVLDGELQSAPNIQTPITDGSGRITGDYTEQEAFALANVLENPLQAPVRIINERKVDPTLGKDSIRSGINASIAGVLFVSAFMLIYYLLAGLVANVALIMNIIILVGVMCSIGTTLTLPGIAGVVLTVGMAVDANVLIFERIREELAKGKSLRGALSAGYDRAFATIFDSHVTTLISSIILIFMGTGPVKGFGVTLTIGVAASLFTALVVTRLIFDWLIYKNIVKTMPMLHAIKSPKVDFMKVRWPAFIASWMLIAIGLSYGGYRGFHHHNLLGVEFAGGHSITLDFDQQHKVEVDKLRAAASRASGSEVLVAYQSEMGKNTLRITVRDPGEQRAGTATEDVSGTVVNELKKNFPDASFKVLGIDSVGPTVGREIQQTAVLASLLAMFGILVYVAFRYEFYFAVGAVVAIIHDVLMTLGCYFLFGRELNATTVAAVLTIIGFSINDTIVIFDRIREDLKLGVRGTFKELINQALNQTLSRTLITSGTVFIATLCLYILGGGPINDFAFTFLVGIITGTYSSIYIASALVLVLHKGQRPKIGNAQMAVEPAAAVKA
jgi:SecD/SecF fusion protein